MASSLEDQTLALAGILQTAYLVDRIARTGNADSAAINGILHSLFVFDSDKPSEVYGGVHNLQLGLRVLRDALAGHNQEDYRGCVRYAFGILSLQKQLEARPKDQTIIRSRLQHTEKKLEHFTQDINEISSSIAAIYQDTISHFNYRIQVAGSQQQLQIAANADRIRALLLAGIRSAWLWRRLGGHRWQLLLWRNRLLKTATALISR
ncbi:MAG: lysogenization regulator HflD [Verrucomicrobiaceae bacterium]|nr:lysogenization regulator HflD [Verrucomicrobiaceae bacterium]